MNERDAESDAVSPWVLRDSARLPVVKLRLQPLAVFLPLQAALHLAMLDLLPVWGDEQFTLNTVSLPWEEIPGRLRQDIHPPLYFLLAKLWRGAAPFLEPVVRLRLFSVVCGIAATVVLQRLWLRGREFSYQYWFLALWCASPVWLLYARMARSYALQTLLAVWALALAKRLFQEQSRRNIVAFATVAVALLYTHYLPGLAVLAGTMLLLIRASWRLAVRTGGFVMLLYVPWLAALAEGLGKAADKQAYLVSGNVWLDPVLRLAYSYFAFNFGEALTDLSLLFTVLITPLLLAALYRGLRRMQPGDGILSGGTAAVGLIGAARWVSLPFMPARLLFLLPVYLMALVEGAAGRLGRLTLACLLAAGIVGDVLYFTREGFLNPGYLIPYSEIGGKIAAESDPSTTVVIADSFNGDPKPLAAVLPASVTYLETISTESFAVVRERLRQAPPQTVWYVRTVRDASGGLHRELEADLISRFGFEETDVDLLLPYGDAVRRLMRPVMAAPPEHHFRVAKYSKTEKKADVQVDSRSDEKTPSDKPRSRKGPDLPE